MCLGGLGPPGARHIDLDRPEPTAAGGDALSHALEVLSRNSDCQVESCLQTLMDSLRISENVGQAFRRAGFSESDAAIIQAGEASGRLDAVFLELAQFYAQLVQARRTVIIKSIYPLLVFHLAAILLAIPRSISANSRRILPLCLVCSGWLANRARFAFTRF